MPGVGGGQPDDKIGQHQEMEEEKNYKGEKWKKNKKEKD